MTTNSETDTPRTGEFHARIDPHLSHCEEMFEMVTFARQLERELNAAKAECGELRQNTKDMSMLIRRLCRQICKHDAGNGCLLYTSDAADE